MKLIQKSIFLKFILFSVVGMQVSSTMLDFQFSTLLEQKFAVQDLRTQFLGRFFSVINTVNVFLQFFGSFLLVHMVGLRGAHLLVPIFLGINLMGFLIWPNFTTMCLSFSSIKALDYSIFGIIKEMLYIPLKVEEKFKAKAIIDVFAYRSSKACASIIIILLQTISWISLPTLISWGVLSIFFLWTLAVFFLFKFYQEEVERQHLNWPQ